MGIEEQVAIIRRAKNKADALRQLHWPDNGTHRRNLNTLIEEHSIEIAHYERNYKNRKYPLIEKECPVCGEDFTTSQGSPKEKHTCSYKCSNTLFRSGRDNPNWKEERYRTTCFLDHEKKCIVCEEENLVDVHHYDENHENNNVENLIPLCPTHHGYVHSSFKHLVQPTIDKYRQEFIKKRR